MMTLVYLILWGALIGLILLALAVYRRPVEPPVSPHIATVECVPGKTTLRMTVNGEVKAVLVLHTLSTDRVGGTTAEFVDLSNYIARTQVQRRWL